MICPNCKSIKTNSVVGYGAHMAFGCFQCKTMWGPFISPLPERGEKGLGWTKVRTLERKK